MIKLSQSEYPYPLTYLLDLPQTLRLETIDHFKQVFLPLSQRYVYLRDIINPTDSRVSLPPYLGPAFACLGSCMTNNSAPGPQSPGGAIISEALFETARILWGVILECDNRETRKSDCIVAVSILLSSSHRYRCLRLCLTSLTSVQESSDDDLRIFECRKAGLDPVTRVYGLYRCSE